MSVIEVTRPHALDREHAVAAANDLAQSLARDFDVHYRWDGPVLHFKRSGAKGRMEVSGNTIHIRLELGFLLVPFKGRIEQEIHKHLDHLTGDTRHA